jgi:hypothetical protein
MLKKILVTTALSLVLVTSIFAMENQGNNVDQASVIKSNTNATYINVSPKITNNQENHQDINFDDHKRTEVNGTGNIVVESKGDANVSSWSCDIF